MTYNDPGSVTDMCAFILAVRLDRRKSIVSLDKSAGPMPQL